MAGKRQNGQRGPAVKPGRDARHLLFAIIVLGVGLGYAAWRVFASADPWRELSARHPAPVQPTLYLQQRRVEMRAAAGVAISRYTAIVDWRESSLFLGQTLQFLGRRLDLATVYPPMQIPARAIGRCTVTSIGADTGVELSVSEPGVRIGFPGYGSSHDPAIVAWCERVGIPVRFE